MTEDIHLYTPESVLRHPKRFFQDFSTDLGRSHELAWRLTVRDISAEYRQTLFGFLWAFVPPLVMAIFFIFFKNQGVLNVAQTNIPYECFALIGTLLWTIFLESLNAPLKMMASTKAALLRLKFPLEAIILASIYRSLFAAAIRMVILLTILVYFKLPFSFFTLLGIGTLSVLILAGISVGVLLAPLGLLYTDITHALPFIAMLWFLLTPVVYPTPTEAPYSYLAFLNPISPLLNASRDLLSSSTFTDPFLFLTVSGITLGFLFFTTLLFRIAMPIVLERTGA